ncbi:hypothetical protein JCM10213v2_002589 [Rhodosporidiobolus nylandii]
MPWINPPKNLEEATCKLRLASKGHHDPAVRAKLEGFLDFVDAELPDSHAFAVLQQHHRWSIVSEAIATVLGAVELGEFKLGRDPTRRSKSIIGQVMHYVRQGQNVYMGKDELVEGEYPPGTALSLAKQLCRLSRRNEQRYGVSQAQLQQRWS